MEAINAVDLVGPTNVADGGWEDVVDLEDQQRRHLQRLHARRRPPPSDPSSSTFLTVARPPLTQTPLHGVTEGGELVRGGWKCGWDSVVVREWSEIVVDLGGRPSYGASTMASRGLMF